ncbi:MAG: ORF6N domain-containing protein [Pseudomonadales bacterium]|nr:ORF6N domain-containing protein [Pseudomonadales bacterium]
MIEQALVPMEHLQKMIFTIRGVQVMVDSDLATVYGVETRALNQAVKRNIDRFPEAFRFQLSEEEKEQLVANCDQFDLRSQIVTSSGQGNSLRSQSVTLENQRGKHRKYLPYVFTEQGVSMLSAALRSETAIKVSIQIINAFVEMRKFIQHNANIFARLDLVERRQIAFESDTEKNFEKIFQALEANEPPRQGIFYNGQVYDAYAFVADLIRKAKSNLALIDNYVDDSVLTLLSKRKKDVKVTIYTKIISKQLALDLKKHNDQYPLIAIETFKEAHDRFLIIDESEIYHIGASLKDLGKKWFAFSKFETGALKMLTKLGRNHG